MLLAIAFHGWKSLSRCFIGAAAGFAAARLFFGRKLRGSTANDTYESDSAIRLMRRIEHDATVRAKRRIAELDRLAADAEKEIERLQELLRRSTAAVSRQKAERSYEHSPSSRFQIFSLRMSDAGHTLTAAQCRMLAQLAMFGNPLEEIARLAHLSCEQVRVAIDDDNRRQQRDAA